MNHADHLHLLRRGVPDAGGVWADLGAGRGAFTLALADLLGPTGTIYAVDRNDRALQTLSTAIRRKAPKITHVPVLADFTQRLELPPLDGIVMANSLHFLPSKQTTLNLIGGYLKPNGRLIVVEYDTDRGNRWVPHPMSFATWASVAAKNGFPFTRLLATRPSSFLGQFYAAESRVNAE